MLIDYLKHFHCVRLSCFVVAVMPEHEHLKLHPLLKRGPGAPAYLHLKEQTQMQCVLAQTQKVAIICGVFEIKLYIHTLGTSEIILHLGKKGIIGHH